MAAPTQANRPLKLTTPLGPDALLLVGLTGSEAISQLFTFQLELLAENGKKIPFDKLLGQNVTVHLRLQGDKQRLFNGIVSRFSQGGRDEVFTKYKAEVVPQFWLWTRKVQSRIFQHLSIPDILKKVLAGLKVTYEIKGTYHLRDYCAQYRESDFAFASRLMEEEGIYYFFNHTDGAHEMVVTDVPQRHPEIAAPTTVIYDEVTGGEREEMRVSAWEKIQEVRSGKHTLWDHCFELPHKHLEAERLILDKVTAGQVSHTLRLGVSEKMEIYDYPGGYAQRFDGVGKGGDLKPADLQLIFEDNERTVKIRAEQEAVNCLTIEGAGNCGHFTAGHVFNLKRHFDADGPYLLTGVEHEARLAGGYRSGEDGSLEYENTFTAIPAGLPYRPQRETPCPLIEGTQTATVVGPAGEEIFCDKYGRVKVQFHWDRDGKKDTDSSCWVRVAQPWAGGNFGAICIPRIGQEVVVAYDEGDPDQPTILGSVYNAGQMPPFTLPENRTFSGIKSNSVGGKPSKNFSGVTFNDKPGSERAAFYAEKDMLVNAENDNRHHVGNTQHATIGKKSLTIVGCLPGIGGGSGGGGNGDNWQSSPIAAPTFGFGGTTIYGFNSQDTMGFMHQITFGQATQIVFDPINAWGYLPDVAAAQAALNLGHFVSLGGNQQLYWGTNYQSTYGPNVNYTYAAQLDITAPPSALTQTLALIVPYLCLIYELCYATQTQQSEAEVLAGAFSVILIAAVGGLAASQKADKIIKVTKDAADAATEATAVIPTLAFATSKLASDFPETLVQHVAVTKQLTLEASLPGGVPLTPADQAHQVSFVDGVSLQVANHLHMIARSDPTDPASTGGTVFINAAGNGTDGVAFINATKGMALTSGGALLELDNNNKTSGDVTVQCGPLGTIMLYNIPICGPGAQLIQLDKTSIALNAGAVVSATLDQKSITLVAGTASITMDPIKGITLQASPTCSMKLDPIAGITLTFATNSIAMGPSGITIAGDMTTVTAESILKLSGATTLIGP